MGLLRAIHCRAQPKLRTWPPVGNARIYEVKFDGWRVQLQMTMRADAIYTKSGYQVRVTGRGCRLLSVRSCLIAGGATRVMTEARPIFQCSNFAMRTLKRCACGPLIFSPSTATICAVVHCLIASTGSSSSCSLLWGEGIAFLSITVAGSALPPRGYQRTCQRFVITTGLEVSRNRCDRGHATGSTGRRAR